jgi:hypothetical protein
LGIDGAERAAFDPRLGNEETIEGITVPVGKVADRKRMLPAHREF